MTTCNSRWLSQKFWVYRGKQKYWRVSCVHLSRGLATQSRQRRDDFWVPTVSIKNHDGDVNATDLLARAGYLRQSYSGIYHMLPLGLRVQDKLERLIDRHMRSIKASKLSLSSISSQNLWSRSGRLSSGSELFRFADRKGAKWLLAPTHEEEITQLVAEAVQSPGQLPIRLYQISRKYRDERRPRGGLLRGREFIMKDLYTFDATQSDAHATYEEVRQAYRNFLADLKIGYIEARADSGDMGGNLSHEYHLPDPAGEDEVITCTACDHARNEEWVPAHVYTSEKISVDSVHKPKASPTTPTTSNGFMIKDFTDKHARALVRAISPARKAEGKEVEVNTYAVKAAVANFMELDTGIEQAQEVFLKSCSDNPNQDRHVYYLVGNSVDKSVAYEIIASDRSWLQQHDLDTVLITSEAEHQRGSVLLKQVTGDPCPDCGVGHLKVQRAIEVGHTFHLGTRYSAKLDLVIRSDADGTGQRPTPVQMGCHGIGVSRLAAAIASALSDSKGLNWPRVIAPFEVVVIVDGEDIEKSQIGVQLYDLLADGMTGPVDTLLDDRTSVGIGYKLKDADLIGYPVIVVVGKTWKQQSKVEVQCRRLQVKEAVSLTAAPDRIRDLLAQI